MIYIIQKSFLFISALSDWRLVEKGTNIDIDLDVTPVQIKTDSRVGSGDRLWVRFVERSTDNGPGISVFFTDQPTYELGYCTSQPQFVNFNMPAATDNHVRIWTITKTDNKIKLQCNETVIFDINYKTNTEICKSFWSLDFGQMKFQSEDTATNFYRPHLRGKFIFIFLQLGLD